MLTCILKRNIVQFVKFEDVKGDLNELRRQTLKEVPKHVMAYMRDHKISPEVLSPLSKDQIEDEKDSYFSELKSKMLLMLQKENLNDAQIKSILDGGIYEFSKEMALFKIKQMNPNFMSLPNPNIQNSNQVSMLLSGAESEIHLKYDSKNAMEPKYVKGPFQD